MGKKIKISKKTSFTLLEMLIVVIIVGILAATAMPGFLGARQKTIDKEARINLKLIQTAEKTHELEEGQYAACTTNAAANAVNHCNNVLNLDLPASTANGGNWTYNVALTGGGAAAAGFNATANGAGGSADWMIDEALEEAQEQQCQ